MTSANDADRDLRDLQLNFAKHKPALLTLCFVRQTDVLENKVQY
jgi:hypothetical protein